MESPLPPETSMPPSAPRTVPPMASDVSPAHNGADRPSLRQVTAALLVGVAIVAVPLYFFRRGPEPVDAPAAAAALSAASDAGLAAAPPPPPPPVTLSSIRVVGCQDPGPGRTPADQCDHVGPVEQALAKALEANAACVPPASGGGSLVYLADVSFLRKKSPVVVTAAREGRTVRGAKTVAGCVKALKAAMATTPLAGVPHNHARYKMAITATYPAAP